MAKSNKNFKKPVNNQEVIISEEEKNKKMIIMVVLAIIVILGLIVGSITYFNGKDVEDDKKGSNDDKNKPTEIIKPVEDDKKPVVNEPKNPVVTTPVVNKPNKPVAVTPTDPKEVTAVIESVNENDYEVTMDGNVIKVSGVSRFTTITKDGEDINNAVVIRVVLDGKYSKAELDNLLVSTTFNGVTTNSSNETVIYEEVTDPVTGVKTLIQYFDYVQPIGIGYDVPTAFTVKIGDEVKTYEVNLDNIKVETLVDTDENSLFVTPYDNTQTAKAYNVDVYRKLSMEEIKSINENLPSTANLNEDETLVSNQTKDATTTNGSTSDLNVSSDSNQGSTPDDTTPKAPAPVDYSKDDIDYTIKFTDVDLTELANNSNKLVIKVYVPNITDENGNSVSIAENDVVVKYLGNGKDEVDPTTSKGKFTVSTDTDAKLPDGTTDNPNKDKVYVELEYDITDDDTLENQKFTIDWDGTGTNSGTITYEFDLSELRKAKEEAEKSQTPNTMDLNDKDIDEEQDKGTTGDEQPNEVNNNIDTPVQPEVPSDSPIVQSQNQVDAGVEGTLE